MNKEELAQFACPKEWIQLKCDEDEIALHRDLDCPFYEQCLSVGANNHWQGFSCSRCLVRVLRTEK